MQQSPWTTPPTQEHIAQIAAAKRTGAKVRRAVSVATFSAWTTAVFAALTLLSSITSIWGLALGMGMALVSVVEFRGVGELKKLDITAPRRLAMNQLAFGTILFAYGAISMWQSLHDPAGTVKQVEELVGSTPELAEISRLTRTLTAAVYGGVMLAAVLGPGLTAVYYYTRKRYIQAYLSQTPSWILDLQRAGMSL